MINVSINTYNDLKKYLSDKSINKILIICGSKSIKKINLKKKINILKLNKEIVFFTKKNSFPDYNELIQITKFANNFKPDLILAIGGGSVIDYAKIVSVLDLNEKNLKKKIISNDINFKKKYKILAIPTTAGSGAEVTSNSVIYIDKIKYSLENKYIRPDNFLLIPELVSTGSNKIKASSGFDAISQAIESMLSKKSNSTSLKFAKKSLEISIKYFIKYLKKNNNENNFKMCVSSNLAGEAINISKTTAPHAVSYPFTSYFGINHGHAVALNLSKFLKFNYMNIDKSDTSFNLNERYKQIFNATKTKNIYELEALIQHIAKEANLELNYNKLGINIKNKINLILSGINEQRLKNNPVNLTIKDVKKIIL